MKKISIGNQNTKKTRNKLHKSAQSELFKFLKFIPLIIYSKISGIGITKLIKPSSVKDIYMAIAPQEGQFLYETARISNAKNIVEFGTSFGVSTIYLAQAIKENGGGKLISTEIELSKCKKAEYNIEQAGLSNYVEIRKGDAIKTLENIEEPIDMVFLDGWKELYLPVLKLLIPKLKNNAVVLADNIYSFKKALLPYKKFVQSCENNFISTTIPFKSGIEYSVYRKNK
jgi:predicted O-methyltransferase YrrM